MGSWRREIWLVTRDRYVCAALALAMVLSALSVIAGLNRVAAERAAIAQLTALVDEDRTYAIAQQSDAGGAAYYAFHLTYDPPSPLSFAAQGIRQDLPWKHRIRMLALEGQIYEADVGNPELALGGRLDFAFIAAVLGPLLLIVLLYDVRAGEIRARRLELLLATDQSGALLRQRIMTRAGLLFCAIVAPFLVGALVISAPVSGTATFVIVSAANLAFWTLLCAFVMGRITSGPTVAATLLAIWLVLALAVPTVGKIVAERTNSVPNGGEILLAQREAVNDAWDLPKEASMEPFLARYPEWAPYAEVTRPFEWKWYYAFQQVGDQTVEDQSAALRDGIARRDAAMGLTALLSPTLLTERIMTRAARTDIQAYQSYEACIREFHAALRAFHYPMLFGTVPYSEDAMAALPTYRPCDSIRSSAP